MSVHPHNYHHQDGYSTYNSYYYPHPATTPNHYSPHQSHQQPANIYEDPYTNSTYWTEEDEISSYSGSCQSGESPGELTPTPSTCSAKDIYEDTQRNFLTSSSIPSSENRNPERGLPVPIRKKGVGGRRKNEKPPTQQVLKKRRVAANAR